MDKLYPWETEIDVSDLAPGDYTFAAMTDDPSGGEGTATHGRHEGLHDLLRLSRRKSPSAACATAGPRPRPGRRWRCAAPRRPSRTDRAPAAANAATSSSVRPPSGPTTTTIRPAAGHLESRQGRGRLLVQDHGQVRRTRQRDRLVGGRQRRDLGEPRPPRLLGGLAGGRPPAGQRLHGPLALPHRDAARRGPRHDPGDPDLGEHLDGQLAPVALGDRLHDDHLRLRRVVTGHVLDGHREHPLAGRGDGAAHRRARAVGQHDLLADPQAAYGDRVVRLVTVDGHLVAAADPGEGHGPGGPGSDIAWTGDQWALNASRSRPKSRLVGRPHLAGRAPPRRGSRPARAAAPPGAGPASSGSRPRR